MTVIRRVTERWHVRFLRVSRHGHMLMELPLAASPAGPTSGAQSQDQEGGRLAQGTASRSAGICIPPLGPASLRRAHLALLQASLGKVSIAAGGRVPDGPPRCWSPPASICPEMIGKKISALPGASHFFSSLLASSHPG